MGATSNLDRVTSTDRQAEGPKPDNTPVGGGASPGGGGGSPTGPAGGPVLAGTYPNPISNPAGTVGWQGITAGVDGFVNNGRLITTPVGYATGGTIQIRFDVGAYDHIELTTAASFSPAGSSGRTPGATQLLDLSNHTGGPLTLTWPWSTWKPVNGLLPAEIKDGQTIRVLLKCYGSAEGTIVASWAANDSAVYNVKDYGADPIASSATNYAAFAACIADAIAKATPFKIYVPQGSYQIQHQLPIALTTGQGGSFVGDGMGSTNLVFTDAGTDNGIAVSRANGTGTYNTDHAFTFADFTVVSSSSAGGTEGISCTATGTDNGQQGMRINRVGFMSTIDGTTNWDTCIRLSNWSQVSIFQCAFIQVVSQSILINGANGVTNTFSITDNYFVGGTYGVKVDGVGGVANRIEGVLIRGNSFILQNYAVWMENSNTGGALEVSGGQINTRNAGAGVHVAGVAGIVVCGISTFNNTGGGGAWNGVEVLDACWDAKIYGNSMAGNNSGGAVQGVYIKGGPGAPPQGYRNVVTGNSFEGFGGSNAVFFDTNVQASICSQNTGDGGAYTDGGGGTVANIFNNNI